MITQVLLDTIVILFLRRSDVMRHSKMTTLVTGSLIGITLGAYAFSHMGQRNQRKMMRRGKKIFNAASYLFDPRNLV